MNSSTINSDWVGQVIDGRFPLLQWLGGSGMGGEFLTELDGDPSRKAAIKLIQADESSAQARIRVWASIATLSHPHLISLFHTGSWRVGSNLLLYAVTEYSEENLSQILPERPLTPSETREMLDPVLDALSYLHKNGFVHGHLKPSNIMVVDDQLKVSSESLQVAGDPVSVLTSPSVYDAPESAAGPISPPADLWSLGALLVEALTQHPPAGQRSTRHEPVVPESIPEPFATIARECLRAAPDRRCTIREIKARLESPQSLSEPASEASPTLTPKKRLTALVAAVLVLILVISAFLLRSHHTPPSTPVGDTQAASPAAAPAHPSSASRKQRARAAAMSGAAANQVLPDVPQRARNTIRGTVVVKIRVTVTPSGAVSDAAIDSSGSRYFSNLALQAARQWRFKPSPAGEQASNRALLLRFEFTQTATRADVVR
ncbi:MAG: TonB family protein [Terracidiphilus sp.]|jgi:TonB family protein